MLLPVCRVADSDNYMLSSRFPPFCKSDCVHASQEFVTAVKHASELHLFVVY